MKLIIPMAGMGTRLRPLTLTVPKPLLKLAGKSIVNHLIDNISKVTDEEITDIGFVIGNFPFTVDDTLKELASLIGAKCHIFVQSQPLGTAHAVYQAKKLLDGKVIVAFADTIFTTNEKFNLNNDAVIFTKKVDNPYAYGVVKKNNEGFIDDFVEKPKTFVSDEAIIGIYYFKNAEFLASVIDKMISENMLDSGEYQLTRALKMMLDNNVKFRSYQIDKWLDTGRFDVLLSTHKELLKNFEQCHKKYILSNTHIVHPVSIGRNVEIQNSVIGPYVSIEDNTTIIDCEIENSIIYSNSTIKNCSLKDSVIGSNSKINKVSHKIYVSDFTNINS